MFEIVISPDGNYVIKLNKETGESWVFTRLRIVNHDVSWWTHIPDDLREAYGLLGDTLSQKLRIDAEVEGA